jgi:hypothetical protein
MVSVKTYIQITGSIVFVIGCIHLVRFLSGWVVVVNGWTVPTWISLIGVLAAWYFAYNAFFLAGKVKK